MKFVKALLLFLQFCWISAQQETTENTCSESLGARKNGYLPDSAFKASSSYDKYGPEKGRLSDYLLAWVPRNHMKINARHWLQVDLGRRKTVTAVVTKGFTGNQFFVRTFNLHFSEDGEIFDPYFFGKQKELFIGNTDSTKPVTNVLACAVVTRFVRFVVRSFPVGSGVALKVDVLGCSDIKEKSSSFKNFVVDSSTANSVKLRWSQVSSSVGVFSLAHYIDDPKKSQYVRYPVKVKNGSLPMLFEKRVSALSSCTKYKFILRSHNKAGCGIAEVNSLTFITKASKPTKPHDFTVTNDKPETLHLTWRKSLPGYLCDKDIQKFILSYKVSNVKDMPYSVVDVDSQITSYQLSRLKPHSEYEVRIVAVSRNATKSDVSIATEYVKGRPPSIPPNITKIVSEQPNTILVQWQEPPLSSVNGEIKGYKLHYRPKSFANYEVTGISETGSKKEYRIVHLSAWKTYEVYVTLYSVDSEISSSVKEVLVIGDGPAQAPSNIRSVATATTITVSWDAVPDRYLSGVLDGYDVFVVGGIKTISADLYKFGRSKNNSFDILQLIPGTNYSFAVAAVSNSTVGPISNISYATTLSGPLPPPVMSVSSKKPGTISIVWQVDSGVIPSMFRLLIKKSRDSDGNWKLYQIVKSSLRAFTIEEDLQYWKSYDVYLNMTSKGGRTSGSNVLPVRVLGHAPGEGPREFRVLKAEFVSITLAWNSIDPVFTYDPVIKYKVRYGRMGDSNGFKFEETTNMSTTITTLMHNTLHHFAVAGVTEKETGVYTKRLTVKTLKINPPMRPQIVSTQNVKLSKIKVVWKVEEENLTEHMEFIVLLEDTEGIENNVTRTHNVQKSNSLRYFSIVVNVKQYVNYRARVKLCVPHDLCSEFSTPEYIRGRSSGVRNISTIRKIDSVIVTWLEPEYLPGILRMYKIDVKRVVDNVHVKVSGYPKNASNTTTTFTLTALPAYQQMIVEITPYIQLPGPTVQKDFLSPEGTPEQPSKFKVIESKGDIVLRWSPPINPNGVVLDYGGSYVGTKYYMQHFQEIDNFTILSSDDLTHRMKNLTPGTKYAIELFARTIKGRGESAFQVKNTPFQEPLAPTVPSAPLDDVQASTATLNIYPSSESNGEIDSYQVIVEELENVIEAKEAAKRARRAILSRLTNYNPDAKMYITAEVEKDKIPMRFKVGDNNKYRGYINQPLKPDTNYKIHVRATSNGPTGQLYGETSFVTVKTMEEKTKEDKVDFPIYLLVLIVVVIIVVVVVVVVVVRIRSSRRRHRDKLSPYELGLIRVQQHEEQEDELDGSPRRRPASLSADYPVRPDHPPISVAAFGKAVSKLHKNDNIGFQAEYSQLEIGKEFSWDTAHLPENKPKNRYANIVAYDHSRVVLSKVNGVPGSDYINASYINGYKKRNAYISTQGPLPNTSNDFWRLVYELICPSIVMLTNLQEKNKLKCDKYWPDDVTVYGDVLVTLARKEYFTDFNIRTFKLEKLPKVPGKNEMREVRQFHFTCWPDHGVPDYPTQMINFRKKVRSYDVANCGPTLVHCSAGVGRTGAYITLDTMLDRSIAQGDVDIFNYIAAMRTRRIAMVQTEEQYVFVYDAILEAIMTGNTDISIHELKISLHKLNQIEDTKVSGFERQWKTLNHASPTLSSEKYATASLAENIEKNRYSTALPLETNRVLLQMMNDDLSTRYINAAYVDGYKQRNAFILTQSPMPGTIADFWRMLFEQGSKSIVMLNALDEGHDYKQFWPDTGICDYGPISVKCLEEDDDLSVTFNSSLKPMYRTPTTEVVARNFKLTDARTPSKSVHIKFFQYTGWTETRVPNSYRPIINLITQIDRWRGQSESEGPLTVLCSDGIGRSGTLAAILFILERVKLDQVFDAFQAIKTMRMQRPHVVKYLDQYKFIHFAVQEYLTAFDEYTRL